MELVKEMTMKSCNCALIALSVPATFNPRRPTLVKTALIALVAAASTLIPLAAVAQTDHSQHMAQTKAAAPAPMTNGVVKKVDAARGEVTIAHDDIKNLGMPKMTMTFRAKDPAWAKKLKEGDQIRFAADMVKGELTLVAYEAVK
jgi:Cu(I)/Ag(I) efflux system protein CusF